MFKSAVLFGLALGAATVLGADDYVIHTFKKIQLTRQFWAEGEYYGDFNHDGFLDVAYGPYWWAGPDFTQRHQYRPATATFQRKLPDGSVKTIPGFEGALGTHNAYSDDFFTWTADFNGDGWTDILVVGFPGKEAYWYENPRGRSGFWKRHVAYNSVNDESPWFTDLTGDGRPELVCDDHGCFGYAEPDWDHPDTIWRFHAITPDNHYQRFTHGLGVGDVNGDGRMDLLEMNGWWQQPASLAGDPVWKQHKFDFTPQEPGLPVGPSQMYAYDVNGDGLNDVITCLAAHGYGLAWYEQIRHGNQITFKRHLIMGKSPSQNRYGVAFTQPHAVTLADIDGDGLQDIVTGKRFWAHGPEGDIDPNGPAVLYWFQLVRHADHTVEFVPHLIDDNSGVGTQVVVKDLNGDGHPDIVVGNKKGGFVFLQQVRHVSRAEWEAAQPKPVNR